MPHTVGLSMKEIPHHVEVGILLNAWGYHAQDEMTNDLGFVLRILPDHIWNEKESVPYVAKDYSGCVDGISEVRIRQ